MSWHNRYIRIPFKDRGREWDGADCWGIVRIIYREEPKLRIELPTLLDYNHTLETEKLSQIINDEALRSWQEIPIGQEQKYDIAIFKTCGVPTHVGVVVRPGFMIHCQKGNDTRGTDYRNSREWSKRLVGFCRYAGK